MFASLGRFAYRWRWPVIALWVAVAATSLLVGGRLFDRLTTVDSLRPDAQSARANQRVHQLLPEGEVMIAVVAGRDLYDPALVNSVTDAVAQIAAMPGVLDVDDAYTDRAGEIGADNRGTVVRVQLSDQIPPAERTQLQDRVAAVLHGIDAESVLVGGKAVAEQAFGDQAVKDAAIGESVALVLVLLLLVVLLGTVTAAGVPLAVALGTIATTLLGLFLVSQVTSVTEYALNVVTLLGFGLAVDYSLLLVYRYRTERRTLAPARALAAACATAGRAVAVSGLAVGAALAGLALFAEPVLAAMAAGGAVVVAVATACALTLVPALLAVAGPRIPAAGTTTWVNRAMTALRRRRGPATATPEGREHLLARLATYAQGRPGPVALGVTVGLLFLAAPFLGANLGNSDARALPRSAEARQAYEELRRNFPATSAAMVTVVIEADPATAAVRDYLDRLNRLPGVAKMEPRPDVVGKAAVIDLTTSGDIGGPPAQRLVRDIRALRPPFRVLVGGPAAEVVDYKDSVGRRLPWAVLVVVVASAVLLFALTGSVVVPVKALLMNLLTLGAALGTLVVVFQWGLGEEILGFDSWGGLDLTTPVLLFVFVFGLTMDYEVFLLARIKEEWDRHGDNDRAVLDGIRASGPAVTAAAVCITVVFLGFLLGGLTAVKEVGFGLAVAVILDVTVVRGLLLPAVMTLLGQWNWWAPWWLRRRPRVVGGPDGADGADGGPTAPKGRDDPADAPTVVIAPVV